jgi:hypothetical protein
MVGSKEEIGQQRQSCATEFVLIVDFRGNGYKNALPGRTIESLSCSSSSRLLALVLSFLASSALLTESVSFRSLACSLCSINCRFLAYE